MTLVTEYFNLGMAQGSVDFVDVNVDGDVPVYIDPTALRNQSGDWAEGCVVLLQSFFEALLTSIRANDNSRLRSLIYPLVEPNETHLGSSKGQSRGRSLGSRTKSEELIRSLQSSQAILSGILADLEDSALMVDGIGVDIVSDIATCVIRRQLISYTQSQARFHSIPMEQQDSGPMWDLDAADWVQFQVQLPRAADRKLLLVPKAIVRVRLTVDSGKYYRDYLRPYFEQEELDNPNSSLVRLLQSDVKRVDLGALDRRLGTNKASIAKNTERHPQAFAEYKANIRSEDSGPLSQGDFVGYTGASREDLRAIYDEMLAVSPGTAGATLYHRTVARLMSQLFGTSLGNEKIEQVLHGGLKRIDITYDNVARFGFFEWLGRHYYAATVVVECKNYSTDAVNPEFDQLAMRFSPGRGKFGVLACRKFDDKSAALDRARAIANDQNGYIFVLDDGDFEALINDFSDAHGDLGEQVKYPLLRQRFDMLLGRS